MPSDDVGFYSLDGPANFSSETLAVFKREKQKNILLLGFVSLTHYVTKIRISSQGLTLSATSYLEGYTLAEGESISSEILHLEVGQELSPLLNSWVKEVEKIMNPRVPKTIPTGWSDWQYYRNQKTERDILENLKVLGEMKKQGYPLEYVVIDGGYALYLSEWLKTKESFPHSMKWLANRIREKGLKFGIWFAPYITNVRTKVAKEHPEWMVTDKKTGKHLSHMSNVGEAYVLDFTIPEALDWLRKVVKIMVKEWGCEWLKLDGPALCHYEGGKLRNPQITTVEMVRKSLEIIREEARDILVEGEGYYGPSIGLVDLQRVQQDNQTNWHVVRRHWANDLMSNFMHNRFWINHRENVILRDHLSPFYYQKKQNPGLVEPLLTDNELKFQITAGFLTGGPMLLTDPLKCLMANPERRGLISKFLPPYRKAARMMDGFKEKRESEIFLLDVRRDREKWKIVGIFNFQDEYRDFKLSFAELGLSPSLNYHIFEFWSQSYKGKFRGYYEERNVSPHACRLFCIREVKNHPQLLSTSLHLSQGAVDLKSVSYLKDKKILKLICNHFIQENAKIFIYLPSGWKLEKIKANANGYLVDTRNQNLLVLYFSGRKETIFFLKFKR